MGNTSIRLELVLDEVNAVLGALGNLPYGQVAGLVEKIREQATQQLPVNLNKTEDVE